jgi:diguanylate cyclase (GGDEF)-like protein
MTWSIRRRTATLVVACMLPAWTVTALVIYAFYVHDRAAVEQVTLMETHSLMLVIERDFAAVEAGLRALSTSAALDNGDWAAFRTQARQVLTQSPSLNIVLTDANGHPLVNTLPPAGRSPTNVVPMTVVDAIIAAGDRVTVSPLFSGPWNKQPLVTLDLPVFRRGKVAYLLFSGLDAAHLGAILRRQNLPPVWVATVLDAEGAIAARTLAPEQTVGHQPEPTILSALEAAPEGVIEAHTLEGVPSVVAYSRSPVYGWTVAIAVPKTVLTADLRRSLWIILVAAAVVLLAGLTVAAGIGRTIARPMRALVAPALAIGRGEPVSLPPLHLKEADEVGQALMTAWRLIDARERERNAARQHADQMERIAQYDTLTGVPSRILLADRLRQAMSWVNRTGTLLAICYLDLDGFKPVNDTLGHDAGDQLLVEIAGRLSRCLRDSDSVVRVGGDEFVVLLVGLSCEAEYQQALQRILDSVHQPIAIGESTATVAASIGVTLYPQAETDPEALLRLADQAMYQAKQQGGNRYHLAADVPFAVAPEPQLPLPLSKRRR